MALFALHTPKTPESVQVRRANNRIAVIRRLCRAAADNAYGVIRIWTPPGLPVFVLISNLCTTASVYPASWSGVATPEP
ncbi:hypothetical protein APB21_33140 [Pseudomonas aeruginosa]|nr:hypothetical protein APB21_33140 [Pseudomonas aeruginosa]